ncbi:tripartite tricarboxylate transporter family receptor [Bordetella bronchiseptica GA96-01]|uniref:tripartite tricarboxylate transporter substrate binding protein n=1 Tax=Bordetella bronchiseptica TaxID=518 RepID=UPI00045A9BB7|nr:tripartite tricarboxylate transporter substrate binding protein [Bordetella bronchiseptica]AZW29675.1 tripartite tricarboxylate transporter substrate binding protein [Bordetella bronchiseptica]KCV45884.1 tripartite tricarboxylate transporter family receptor [Bordetella bronchiseptica 345]KDC41705.1 tripartite tricarboxylate transporter family receptor [Bordetella bronchiseptica GA96-01]
MLKNPGRRRAASLAMRVLLAGGLAAGAAAQAAPAYPDKPVRLIVPFAAGGFSDVLTRVVGAALAEKWGQPVVVENRAGANGVIGTTAAARAAPDGYTLLVTLDSHVSNNFLVKSLPYDTMRDFAPIAFLGTAPMVLMAYPAFPAANVADVVRLAKAQPNGINYGTLGSGSQIHMAARMLETAADIQMTPVPYKGGGPAVSDLMAGHIQLLFASVTSSLPVIQQKRAKALAVVFPKRLAALPDVPTMAEQGYPAVEKVGFWFGVMAPAGTPAPVIEQVQADLMAVVAQPDVARRLGDMGLQMQPMGPAEFGDFVKSELDRWAGLVKRENIQPQ